MNPETQIKLQAYLDGELSGVEVRTIAAQLDRDPEARALYASLKEVKTLLDAGEVEIKVPESREFYWSKIEKAILRESQEPRAAASGMLARLGWFRILAPAAGAALVLTAALSVMKLTTAPAALSYLHEIESPLDDTSTISFHSQSAGVTVVWVQSQEN